MEHLPEILPVDYPGLQTGEESLPAHAVIRGRIYRVEPIGAPPEAFRVLELIASLHGLQMFREPQG